MLALNIDGAAVEIVPGVPFVDAEANSYPANWLDLNGAAACAAIGLLDIVEPPPAPAGKILTITGLTITKGKPTRTFVVEDPPAPSIEAGKAALRLAVDAKRDTVFAAGFTPATGPLASHTLQTRDGDDKVNWLTSQAAYSAAVMAGQGAAMGATFRTADNITIVMSFADGLSVLLSMAAWGSAVFGRSWALKDAIEAAGDDPAALDAIDITVGWPI